MNVISDVSLHAISETQPDSHAIRTTAVLCAIAVGAALYFASFGLDLSAGFF
jgi:hypothetical protein